MENNADAVHDHAPDDADRAREALAAIDATRSSAADRLVTPWWYHPALGALTSAYLVGYAFGDTLVRLVVLAGFLVALGLLAASYRRLTGVWVSGHRAGRATVWAVAMGVLAMALVAAALLLYSTTGLEWPVWACAAVVFVSVVVLGRAFDAKLRAELRSGRVAASR